MNIEIYKGNTDNINVEVDMNISGWTWHYQVRVELDEREPILVAISGVTTEQDSFIIPISSDDTTLSPGNYKYEIWVENPYNIIKKTLHIGYLKILTNLSAFE
jgi:hypothetical protein